MTALEVLKQYFGYSEFRSGQEELINGILAGRDVLGIMPTGAGKSVCFQIPALMSDGITLVVSPLISLMKDQVNALTQGGVAAAFINSSLNQRQIEKALQNAEKGMYKLIYVAPERLPTSDFMSFVRSVKISMLTVDEAHCISQWGQDFRPSYAQIPEFIAELPKRPVVSAFTATATPKVREDIVNLLKLSDPQILVTGFDRQNLFFDVQKPRDKYAALSKFLGGRKESSGIVYCATRKTVEEVCERLRGDGFSASRYHAGLADFERRDNQDDFLYDRAQIMVATNAFGMGIDKSNVSFVVHYNMPKDIESYYQEAGRAGRDGEPADCVLLYSARDARLCEWMIENSDNDAQYPDEETEEMLKERSLKRLREMTFYSTTTDCLRGFILKYFGEAPPNHCGNCGSCNANFETADITIDAQQVLSCVARMNERFGSRLVVDVLLGNRNDRVEQLGLDKLTTFGISKRQTRQLREIVDFLVSQRYLLKTNDEYPIIKLGERAGEVLREKMPVHMKLAMDKKQLKIFDGGGDGDTGDSRYGQKRRRDKGGKQTQSGGPLDSAMFYILRKLRLEISKEQNIPAYVIFSDSTLVDMCFKTPRTREQFLGVSGVGEVKLERYGEKFLGAINEYLTSKKDTDAGTAPSKENNVGATAPGRPPFAGTATLTMNGKKTSPKPPKPAKSSAEQPASPKSPKQPKQPGLPAVKELPRVYDASLIEISDSPVTVSVIADRINCVFMQFGFKRLSGQIINDWLVAEGYAEVINEIGKNRKVPTAKGTELGIISEDRFIRGENLRMNIYGRAAQEMIIQNALNIP